MAEDFRTRLKQIPGDLEDYMLNVNAAPYWKKLAQYFPRMVRQMNQNSRVGGIHGAGGNEQVLVTTAAPLIAAHNLVAATELALS